MKNTSRERTRGPNVLARVRALCDRLDATSRLVVPLALSISAGLSGCAEECFSNADCAETERCVGADNECPDGAHCILPVTPSPGVCEPEAGQCADGVDNDHDGAKDCSDADCNCRDDAVAMYSAPFGY